MLIELKSLEWETTGHGFWFCDDYKLTDGALTKGGVDLGLELSTIKELNDFIRAQRWARFCDVTEEITIRFPSSADALSFKEWLCNSGEQRYWDWQDNAQERAVEFDYWVGKSIIDASRISEPEDQ